MNKQFSKAAVTMIMVLGLSLILTACGGADVATPMAQGGNAVATGAADAGKTVGAGVDSSGTTVVEAGSTLAADAGTAVVAGATKAQEADHIQVQHILIGFQGSVPGAAISRSKEEAQKLAYDLLQQAQTGADFDALVKQHTDDSHPGIYGMSNRGVQAAADEYPRDGMVPAFGNVGFPLQVGEVGIADYDTSSSPYGWHIIKRLK